ncbi:MAG: hypothetical protein JXA24_04560 [Proteobacteria bacterium]|nr:hypothetical protein [Pseudomonadota bacterium]
MNSSPVVLFRLFAPIQLPDRQPLQNSIKTAGALARTPLSIEVNLHRTPFVEGFRLPAGRFASHPLFAEIPWRNDPGTKEKTTELKGEPQTEFPYPYYIDDYEEEAVSVSESGGDEEDMEELEIAARRIVRFPHPNNYGRNLARTLGRKPCPRPPSLRGAELLARFIR